MTPRKRILNFLSGMLEAAVRDKTSWLSQNHLGDKVSPQERKDQESEAQSVLGILQLIAEGKSRMDPGILFGVRQLAQAGLTRLQEAAASKAVTCQGPGMDPLTQARRALEAVDAAARAEGYAEAVKDIFGAIDASS